MPSDTRPSPIPLALRFDVAQLQSFVQTLLLKTGMPQDKATDVADILIEADLLGHETHGLQLLPTYLEEIGKGGMALEGEPELLADQGAVVTWDGRRLPGPWLVLRAIALASERARRLGVGVVCVRRSHHIAALAPYARRVAQDGLVLLLLSSAPAGSSVAPFGGTQALFSPSPIAVGFPTGADPVMVDVSTSITTNNMVNVLARQGRKLPGAWLMDEAGVPSADPAVVRPPRKGTLLPLGGTDAGHKGYGLSLMVEALTAGLAGHGRADPGLRWGATLFIQVLDPQAFSGSEAFAEQMDWIVDQCHGNTPLDAARPVRMPGERALSLRSEQLTQGVRLSAEIVNALRPWANKFGLELPFARE
jgi:LDH2 family malate/lactate/ureidoglycolate dehydrogenase